MAHVCSPISMNHFDDEKRENVIEKLEKSWQSRGKLKTFHHQPEGIVSLHSMASKMKRTHNNVFEILELKIYQMKESQKKVKASVSRDFRTKNK